MIGCEMLQKTDISDVEQWLEEWRPTHFLGLRLLPTIHLPLHRLDHLVGACLHRVQRKCYPRHAKKDEKIQAIGWAETCPTTHRQHLHLLLKTPPHPAYRPAPTDIIGSAWDASAPGAGVWVRPLADALNAFVYSQKHSERGSDSIVYA